MFFLFQKHTKYVDFSLNLFDLTKLVNKKFRVVELCPHKKEIHSTPQTLKINVEGTSISEQTVEQG